MWALESDEAEKDRPPGYDDLSWTVCNITTTYHFDCRTLNSVARKDGRHGGAL